MTNGKLKAWTLSTLEGTNKVYNNWVENTGITKGAFIDGLEWLLTNPELRTERGFRRKCIKCEEDGTITKIIQVNTGSWNWYETLDGEKCQFTPNPLLSSTDWI